MLKFAPNQKIFVSRTEKGDKYEANILASVNNTLVITRPKINLGNNKVRYIDYLNAMNLIFIQYIYEGVEYFFRTIVIKASFTPFPYIIIKYPKESNIKIRKIRKFDRFDTILPLKVGSIDKSFELHLENVFAVDISIKGIGIVCEEKLPPRFIAEFFSGKFPVRILCSVKVVKPNQFGKLHFFGCEIEKVTKNELLEEYIEILKSIKAK